MPRREPYLGDENEHAVFFQDGQLLLRLQMESFSDVSWNDDLVFTGNSGFHEDSPYSRSGGKDFVQEVFDQVIHLLGSKDCTRLNPVCDRAV